MAREFSRMDRISDLIQKELSMLILQEIKDPRMGMVTLSQVIVSKDLAHAKVLISVIQEEKIEDSVATLNKASGFLRSLLAKKLHTRIVPHLIFIHDKSTLAAHKLTKLIDDTVAKDRDAHQE